MPVGIDVGSRVGIKLGFALGCSVGCRVGKPVGDADGGKEGMPVGIDVGSLPMNNNRNEAKANLSRPPKRRRDINTMYYYRSKLLPGSYRPYGTAPPLFL